MSAGTMNSVGGQLLAQGYAGMGDSIAQGVQQYAMNKRLDATTTGQIEGLLQNGIQQGTAKNWSPQTQKLAQKLSQGSATLNDKMTLLGSLQTDQAMQTENLKRRAMQQENDMRQRQLDAINRVLNGGQPNATQGAPQPTPGGGSASTSPMQDKIGQFVQNFTRQTGTLPPPEAIAKFMEMQANVEQPAGVVYAGPKFDVNGNAQFDRYNWVYKKADGGTRVDNSPIDVPYHSAAPGTLLDSSTFAPSGQRQPDTQGVIAPAPGQPPVKPPAHIKTPEQDKAIEEANSDYQTLLQQQKKITDLASATEAYAKAPLSSNYANWLTGKGWGLNVRAATGDTTGQKLEAAASPISATVMSGLKNIRNQREFDAMMKQVPRTTDPSDVAMQKVGALSAQYGQMLTWNKNYKDNLVAGMAPGAASEKASNETPLPGGAAPATPKAQGSTARIKTPSGTIMTIPAANLQKAIEMGATQMP